MATLLSNRDIYTSVVCGIGFNDGYDADICGILVSNSDDVI